MRSGLAGLFVVLVSAALLFLGCAKRGAPPGGPEDKTPPYVETFSPTSGSVAVELRSEISLTFSELMKHRTVETAVVVSPPCQWAKRYWRKNTYVLVPGQPLLRETTYLVSVGNAATDRHAVKMEKTFVAGFSTGASIEAGVISGKVTWKGLTVEQAMVEVFDAEQIGDLAGFPKATPLYVTLSGAGGQYEVPFVNTKKTYRVLAYMDRNGDSEYDEGEVAGCAPGEVALMDSLTNTGVDIMLCDASFKGSLEGKVYTSSQFDTSAVPDTSKPFEAFKVAVSVRSITDTTVSYDALADKDGRFRLDCVSPGSYVIEAFADHNGNAKKDKEDSFYVEFGDTIDIRSCSKPPTVEMTLEVKP